MHVKTTKKLWQMLPNGILFNSSIFFVPLHEHFVYNLVTEPLKARNEDTNLSSSFYQFSDLRWKDTRL